MLRFLIAFRRFSILSLLLFLVACSSSQGEGGPPKSVPVVAALATRKSVPLQVKTIGNVQAYSTVLVKSQIAGEIFRVNFREGQDVRKGDLLFTIDPRPFEAALKQAEANLSGDMAQRKQAEANVSRDTVQAENAQVEAKRYEMLVEKQVVAKQQYDHFRTNAEALGATVLADQAAIENAEAGIRADRAAVENARIQLGYCSIRSPIEGRTGNLLVQQGNVIKANDIPLVSINQISPIFVTFSVPEQNLSEIKKYMASGTLHVEAFPPNDPNGGDTGVLTFVDNAVDSTTGTILLKASFGNTGKRLWPGEFVNVILTLTVETGVLTVPSHAIQTGQQGEYVFVIKPDLAVEQRSVRVSRVIGDESIVSSGLESGERVVTDGQLQLVPGTKVEIKTGQGGPRKSS